MHTTHEVRIIEPGAGDTYTASGSETAFKVRGQDTAGMFEVTESLLPPRFAGPPAHVHGRIDHAFYVLEGEVEYQAGERNVRAAAGTTLFVPHDIGHKFANPGDGPARMLQIDSIGGREQMFKEMSGAFPPGSPLDAKILMEILSRYDTRPV